MLPATHRSQIQFRNNRPSFSWVTSLIKRHRLSYRAVRVIEDKQVKAVTRENIAEHISRLAAALKRFRIKDPIFIMNMDQSGTSFKKMTVRSLRKGVGLRNMALIHKCVRTKGNLERVTIMPVVSAAGKEYTPVLVYPGKQAHFRRVRGQIQTLHSVLPTCFLYHREVPGVEKDTIYDWAKKFVQKTVLLRRNSQKLLLLIEGYGSHVQFKTLQLFRDNGIIFISMPAHTSHVLQPLDVSVFSSYKSVLQKEIHRSALVKKVLGAFDIGLCINKTYSGSATASNIISGFISAGVWDPNTFQPSIDPLKRLFRDDISAERSTNISLEDVVSPFVKKGRSLLLDVNVDESGTVKVSTKTGAHLTSDAVLSALKTRENKHDKQRKRLDDEKLLEIQAYKEPAAGIRRLAVLAERRVKQRQMLKITRRDRRLNQIGNVRERLFYEYGHHRGPYPILSDVDSSGACLNKDFVELEYDCLHMISLFSRYER